MLSLLPDDVMAHVIDNLNVKAITLLFISSKYFKNIFEMYKKTYITNSLRDMIRNSDFSYSRFFCLCENIEKTNRPPHNQFLKPLSPNTSITIKLFQFLMKLVKHYKKPQFKNFITNHMIKYCKTVDYSSSKTDALFIFFDLVKHHDEFQWEIVDINLAKLYKSLNDPSKKWRIKKPLKHATLSLIKTFHKRHRNNPTLKFLIDDLNICYDIV